MDTAHTLGPLAATTPAGQQLPERYEDLGHLGSGGMATVRRVRDKKLGVSVAMKILRSSLATHTRTRTVFLNEARLTAQLVHPGVVALQDMGELDDGRPWFTMEEIRGQTLHQALTQGDLPQQRRVAIVQRVAEVMAYAHDAGVIHRDLKPRNIMVGAFGEVRVTDWGLGCYVRDTAPAPAGLGTPGWMSPEQLEGGQVGCASDCFALGTLLRAVLDAPPPPPLEMLATLATDRNPSHRPDASQVAEQLLAWLDGAQRRTEASQWLAQADALNTQISDTQDQAARIREAADALLQGLPPHVTVDQKRPAWDLEDQAETLTVRAEVTRVQWQRALQAVLTQVPEHLGAHTRLADHHAARLLQAERLEDTRAVARHEALLRTHNRGSHSPILQGLARIDLVTDPPGAEVWLHPVETVGRLRTRGAGRRLGTSPIFGAVAQHGHYIAVLRMPGKADVTYPITVQRGGHWHGCAPGSSNPHPIHLPTLEASRPGWRYVPAGGFWVGGDADAPDAMAERWLWVDGLWMGTHPVTNAEYARFLDSLDDATERVPRPPGGAPVWSRGADRRWSAPGPGDHPVTWICHADAVAYTAWKSRLEHREIRLPTGIEWEKSARGPDRRHYPCGMYLDPTWAVLFNSSADRPQVQPVASGSQDVSPYGVRGLAGNVRDWCADAWTPAGGRIEDGRHLPTVSNTGTLEVRGGAYLSGSALARSCARLAAEFTARAGTVGFRCLSPLAY